MQPSHSAGRRFLFLVDLHWRGSGEPRLPDPEFVSSFSAVVLGGDLTTFGGVAEARRIVEGLRAAGPPVLVVCGNCDSPDIEKYLADEGIGLDCVSRPLGGVRWLGLSAGLPFGGLPYERTEHEYKECCGRLRGLVDAEAKQTRTEPLILVSHQPPQGTICDLIGERHVGSVSIRQFVEELQPDLVIGGHIHEAIGIDRIGTSAIANPGPWFEGRWAEIEVEKAGDKGTNPRVEVTLHGGPNSGG